MKCGVHFWGAYWTDASIYTHFFANSGPGGGPVRDGVYVEIGAQHGLGGSNTLFFEQHLNWSGTLIEPTACATCVLPHTRLVIRAAADARGGDQRARVDGCAAAAAAHAAAPPQPDAPAAGRGRGQRR